MGCGLIEQKRKNKNKIKSDYSDFLQNNNLNENKKKDNDNEVIFGESNIQENIKYKIENTKGSETIIYINKKNK